MLSEQVADRFAEPAIVTRKLMQQAYLLGKANRLNGLTTAQYVRQQLDRLGIGMELTEITWGMVNSTIHLPPSESRAKK